MRNKIEKFPISNFQFPVNSEFLNFKFRNFLTDWQLETGNWKLKAGFTLIELLVVMAIVAIIATIGLTTYPQAQKQARDQNRKSDLNQYRSALESYANGHNGNYPSGAQSPIAATQLCTISDWPSFASACPEVAYTDSAYQYKFSSDGGSPTGPDSSKYVIWAKLESTANTYWVVCSDGRSKNYSGSSLSASNGSCPL